MGDILRIENVSKNFGRRQVIRDVSLKIKRGTVTAIIGPNGAGKTTLFNLVSGLLAPDAGSISFRQRGRKWVGLTSREPWQIARLGIGRLFQDLNTFEHLSALENVMTAFDRGGYERLFTSVFRPWRVEAEEAADAVRALKLLKLVGLEERAGSRAGELSFGQQKLLSIARMLAAEPELLLLDEPTAGLSRKTTEDVLKLILRLVRGKTRKTVVIIEHNLHFVDTLFVHAATSKVSDWCCVMDEGQVIYNQPGGLEKALNAPS